MRTGTFAAVVLGLASWAAQAQAGTGVTESTDPARAAAIEKAAAALKNRPPPSSVEIVRGKTAAGHAFVSGGISQDQRMTMHAERQPYNLWVATVARPSGAYLVDVELRIVRMADKAVVMQRTMEGPWLLLALPEGRYEVVGSFKERPADASEKPQTLNLSVNVPKKGQRQAVLRFVSAATVDSESPGAFQGNPFATPAVTPPAAK